MSPQYLGAHVVEPILVRVDNPLADAHEPYGDRFDIEQRNSLRHVRYVPDGDAGCTIANRVRHIRGRNERRTGAAAELDSYFGTLLDLCEGFPGQVDFQVPRRPTEHHLFRHFSVWSIACAREQSQLQATARVARSIRFPVIGFNVISAMAVLCPQSTPLLSRLPVGSCPV